MHGLIAKWAGGMALAACAAGCGVLLWRRLRPRGERPPAPDDAVPAAIADGIRRHAEAFDGLFEGLYQAAQIQGTFSAEAYSEWCDRVDQLGDAPFQRAFSSLFSKADAQDEARCRAKYRLLLRCIAEAGIVRDRDRGPCCQADETMHRAYLEVGGGKPQIGVGYTVIKAAWLRGGTVIEYGMVMPGAVSL